MNTEIQIYRHIRYASAARGGEPQLADYQPAAEGTPCACPQNPFRMDFLIDTSERLPQSEDCHFLTIFSPTEEGERLPVVVWFHGGAYLTGSGESAFYDASTLPCTSPLTMRLRSVCLPSLSLPSLRLAAAIGVVVPSQTPSKMVL